jgi:hypothetical protein
MKMVIALGVPQPISHFPCYPSPTTFGPLTFIAPMQTIPGFSPVHEILDASPLRIRGIWQSEEDERLRKAVNDYGLNNWESVASVVHGRTATQCRERWTFRLCPTRNKAPFEELEDALILEQREQRSLGTSRVAVHAQSRTDGTPS